MRTLEAWGAMIENDRRAYYTAGGRVWVLDLEPAAGKKKRLPRDVSRAGSELEKNVLLDLRNRTVPRRDPAHRRHARDRGASDVRAARSRL